MEKNVLYIGKEGLKIKALDDKVYIVEGFDQNIFTNTFIVNEIKEK